MDAIIEKLLAESPMAAALIVCAYMLRPVLKMYLDQQIEQLKVIAAAVAALATRLDEVEKKVDGRLVEIEHKVDDLAEITEDLHRVR